MNDEPLYQDYVIKDGRFVGEFEKMYQMCEDPWHQAKKGYVENSISRQVACTFVNMFEITSLVEFGCGLGHTTKLISDRTNIDIIGVDISETSIDRSRKNYPDLNFEVNNIGNIIDYNSYQCFFFSEITWYILEDKMIDQIFDDIKEHLKGKYFLHNLVFYKGQQKYGRNYFTTLDEFIEFCPFQLLGKVEIDFERADTIETSSIFKI